MKIMVCYDGTNVANDAIRQAVILGERLKAAISIVRSVSVRRSNDAVAVEHIEADLEAAKAQLQDKKIAVETHLLIRGGSAGEDLTAFAAEQAFDYITIGVKRRSKVGKMLFGSTAQYVIIHADCPVVTVK
jgi:nucleotide-binding universal stress UspA family protein